ncbi:MAG: alpha/beta fold hydrolase [Deltaproteobacteria bacterium]|nr:alpha/beta fold hydrolase [Deltaproteobacteria bacterium]
MKLRRRRDAQQWILDHMVKTTGRVQNFATDTRQLPPAVKTYAMISKTVGQHGLHAEALARSADAASHRVTALQAYTKAIASYIEAQHTIFEDDNAEKIYWYTRALECHARVRELAGHPIERVEVPWEKRSLPGMFHLQPDRKRRPTIIFIPGMDGTKESSGVGPLGSAFMPHGVHVFTFDGPGQGESNLRKIRITHDNYERAISAAVDYLLTRPEVDANRLGLIGSSFGSLWGLRAAATDVRIKAAAVVAVCFGDKRGIFEQASPRFKQVFMYMAGIHDEEAFDRMAEQMTSFGCGAAIRCPTLICSGEFDPLTRLNEVLAMFEEIGGPKELWVFENEFHDYRGLGNLCEVETIHFMIDWVMDALAGKFPENHRRITLIPEAAGAGPYEDRPLFAPWRQPGSPADRQT